MKTLYRIMDGLRNILIMAVLSFIIVVGAVQIVMRYTPGINAMNWVDEIMRYLNIWVIFLAAGIGIRESSHLQLEYFLRKIFRDRTIVAIRRVSQVAAIAALLVLVYFGALRVIDNLRTVIQSMPLSISWFYAAIPIGSAMMIVDVLMFMIYGGHPFAAATTQQG